MVMPDWLAKYRVEALALAACLAFPGFAAAQPKTVAEIANYTGSDRQALLEAGAKREGVVMVYMTGTQIQPLLDGYRKKYPYVKVESSRLGSVETSQKILEEYAGGVYQVDVFELAAEGLFVPRAQGVLQPFTSPELAAYEKEAIEPEKRWVSVREGYIGVGFNTDKVSVDQAPKTYDDLLDPKWKGRMALSGSISTAANWLGVIYLDKGEAYLRKLAAQNSRIYQVTSRAISNLMITGEVELAPMTYASHVVASNAAGARLGWNAPGPVYVLDTVAALAVKAPHPYGSMLLIDFLASKEGQLLYREIGYDSARTDMPPSGLPPLTKMFLSNRPTYLDEFETWARLFRELFDKGGK
jgi:iron(III) transport system substrate-binding protein